jgi:hypothetical protein
MFRLVHGFRGSMLLSVLAIGSLTHAQDSTADESDDLFFFRPQTPARQISGALLAERLDRPTLARTYLAELIATQPDNETLLQLRSDFGIGTFLKLSSIEVLHPESRDLLKLMNEASRQEAPTAQTVELLIDQLDGDARDVANIVTRILAAEENAVVPLLKADSTTTSGKRAGRLLQQHARRFRRGLLQALDTSDGPTTVRILRLLARTAAPELSVSLWKYAFAEDAEVVSAARAAIRTLNASDECPLSSEAAALELSDRALRLLKLAGHPFPSTAEVARERQIAQQYYANQEVTEYGAVLLQRAVELARDGLTIHRDAMTEASALLCESTLQAWPLRWPTDAAVPPVLDTSSVPAEADQRMLQQALQSENPAAVLQVLRRPATAAIVLQDRRTLRRCEDFPDARVRLLTAAVASVNGVERKSLQVILQKALTATARPEAVAIDSRPGQSRETASVLQEMKYAAQAASTGISGFESAANQLHCDLLMVHSNCIRWPLSQTIANLRADARTSTTPIVIYGPANVAASTEVLRANTDGVWFVVEPVSELTLPDNLKLLNVTPPRLTAIEREAMNRFARRVRDQARLASGATADGN